MDSERWNKIQTLFDAALELGVTERTVYLQEQCSGDAALYEEIISLLEADSNVHKLLEGLAIDVIGLAYEQQYLGKRIGPYRLIEHLGSGGMSYVFLAERDDGHFKQRVALKLIKRGMESEQILQRFRSERQILSRLDHPNIARLLDGGLTGDGMPYFTMEYVQGTPIDQYCDQHRLSLNDRLALFGDVCRAVQYAHTNLVIHRDLKPGNIFVSVDGTVKLLDFGIAKVLGDGQDDHYLTRTGLRVMTPEYAAPEQVQSAPVTTATDVYALGMVLYELLTGHRPYTLTSSSPAQMEHIVCNVQPQQPSTIISQNRQADTFTDLTELTPQALAAKRKISLPRWRNVLRGDLDTICLTALQKEPQRRYQSAEQLLHDIVHFQKGLPISARRETTSYRLKKFIQRHKRGLLVSFLMMLILVSINIYYNLRITNERDLARLEAAKADQIAQFLTGLFEISDPSVGRGESVTARELLARGAQRIRVELADQPEVQATLMDVIGNVYQSLGLYTEAQPLLRQALEIRQTRYEERHPLVAHSLNNLALSLQEQGNFSESETLFRKALQIQRDHYGAVHEDIAVSLFNLAEVRRMQGDFDQAEQLLLESHEMYRTLYGEQHKGVAETIHTLAVLQDERGSYDDAEKNYRAALTLFQNLYGEYHPDVGNTYNNFASLYRHKGMFAQAESLYWRALDVRKKILDADHPDLAYTYNHMGRLYQSTERYAEAEQSFREGLRIRETALGSNHPATTASLSALANLFEVTGQFQKAESLYVETYAIMLEVWGKDHHYIGATLNNIGRVQYALKKYSSAERYLRQSIGQLRQALSEDHVNVARPMLTLGNLLMDLGRMEEASVYLQSALELREKTLPEYHHLTESARLALGTFYLRNGDYERAQKFINKAHEALQQQFGADHRDTRQAALRLAELNEQRKTNSD